MEPKRRLLDVDHSPDNVADQRGDEHVVQLDIVVAQNVPEREGRRKIMSIMPLANIGLFG